VDRRKLEGSMSHEVFDVSIRTARKAHKCGECGRSICTGDRYEYAFIVSEGDAMQFKSCLPCSELREYLCEELIPPEYMAETYVYNRLLEVAAGYEMISRWQPRGVLKEAA
jgi:hypothetical protein